MELNKTPYDYNIERSYIGQLLCFPEIIYQCYLKEEDFYSNDNRKIFVAIQALHTEKKEITINLVCNKIEWCNIDELYELSYNTVSSSWNLEYQEIIKDLSNKRKIINACKNVYWMAVSDESSIEISSKAKKLFDIEVVEKEKEYFFDTIESYWKGTSRVCSSWIKRLDDICDWLHPQFYIVWGRPWVWKTFLSCHLAKSIFNEWNKCLYITMEMTGQQIADRIIANTMQVPYNDRIRKRADEIPSIDFQKIIKLQENVKIKSWSFTIEKIIYLIRNENYTLGTKFFFIDHIWLITPKGKGTRNEEIGSRTYSLKQLQLELWITIFWLCQLSRPDKKFVNKKPKKEDLRDSGNIEQDADIIWLLYRYEDEEWIQGNDLEIIVCKNRVNWWFGVVTTEIYWNTFSLLER